MGVLVEWPSLTALPQTLRIVLWSCVIDWLIRTPYNWKPRLLLQKILRNQVWYAGSKRRDVFSNWWYFPSVWYACMVRYSSWKLQHEAFAGVELRVAWQGELQCHSRESLVIFLFDVIAIDDSWGQYAQAMTHSGVEAFFKESRCVEESMFSSFSKQEDAKNYVVRSPNFMVFWYRLEVVQPALHQQWSPLHIESGATFHGVGGRCPWVGHHPMSEWVDEDVFVWFFERRQVARGRWVMLSFRDDKATRCWRKWICMGLFFSSFFL